MSYVLEVRKCTLKLAAKWAALVFGVGMVVVVVLWIRNGDMPLTETIRTSYASEGTNHPSVRLPIVWWRLIDPFAMMVPAALLAWAGFDKKLIYNWWTRGEGATPNQAEDVIGSGWIIGFLGAIAVAGLGFKVAIIGSVIAALAALFIGCPKGEPVKASWSFSIEVVSAVMFWLIGTLLMGTIPALFYTLMGLGIAAVVHFGVYYGVRTGYRFITGGFSRTMLSCPAED